MRCDFLEWRGGTFSGGYYCLKKQEYISDDTKNRYCDNSLEYRNCPIYKGNDSGGCYLTTACVEYKGLPDDCEELGVLRDFRDNHMAHTAKGESEISEYYRTAPKIVQAIDKRDDAKEIYEMLYSDVIVKCVDMIRTGQEEKAHQLYKKMVERLKKEYC